MAKQGPQQNPVPPQQVPVPPAAVPQPGQPAPGQGQVGAGGVQPGPGNAGAGQPAPVQSQPAAPVASAPVSKERALLNKIKLAFARELRKKVAFNNLEGMPSDEEVAIKDSFKFFKSINNQECGCQVDFHDSVGTAVFTALGNDKVSLEAFYETIRAYKEASKNEPNLHLELTANTLEEAEQILKNLYPIVVSKLMLHTKKDPVSKKDFDEIMARVIGDKRTPILKTQEEPAKKGPAHGDQPPQNIPPASQPAPAGQPHSAPAQSSAPAAEQAPASGGQPILTGFQTRQKQQKQKTAPATPAPKGKAAARSTRKKR